MSCQPALPLLGLSRTRSNSEPRQQEPYTDPGAFQRQPPSPKRRAETSDQPEILRERSNSTGNIDLHHSIKLPSTPRAAGFDALEWEETGGEVQERGENECIRVAARFRPLSEKEITEGAGNLCVRFGNEGKTCAITVDRSFGKKEVNFAFDFMFQSNASQQDVYLAVAQPIVDCVIRGFNGAIIAYGQTGSGKTHTMLGPDGAKAFLGSDDVNMEEMGIIPRALQELLDYARPTEGAVQLRASYLEIYQEHVIDLLAPVKRGADIPTSATMSEGHEALYLPEMTETPVASVRQALEVMRTGNINRHMAETKMNRHSSRSHAVFVVTVTSVIDRLQRRFGQLYLVDLAGSERVGKTGVIGQQLEEAKQINKSLLALGQVIWALAHKQKHVPYRDSKLTQLLRNSLGGNARTAILVAASPHVWNANESLSALRFGARASLVENLASVNVAEDPKELKRLLDNARRDLTELRSHCRQLQSQVAAFHAVETVPISIAGVPQGCREGRLQGLTSKRLLVWGLMPALMCPITRAVMADPVCASDGWTYERRALEKHFTRAGRSMPLSPVTGVRMTSRTLVSNAVVKQLIRQHMPDLPPAEERLPILMTVHVWHVQTILCFLDAKSLARCESAWPSFMAAAESMPLWAQLLAKDFPSQTADGENARFEYQKLALEKQRTKRESTGAMSKPPSKGLTLQK